MEESKKTTDHQVIKQWVNDRNGEPAVVKGTQDEGSGVGVLRINFPGYEEDDLEKIDWEDFFETFEDKKLAFLYSPDSESRFFKFVGREG